MRPAFLTLLILIAGSMAAGQKTPIPPGATATIEGVVLNAGTGQPLKKAWISLRAAEGRESGPSVTTDAAGHFVVEDIEPGRYVLRADRNGFVSQAHGQRGASSSGTILTLAPGQTMRDIEFRLLPAAAISGHIYDEDGDPVASARVSAMRLQFRQRQRTLTPAGSATTNDLGEFRIFGLVPGSYYVSGTSDRLRPGSMDTSVRGAEGAEDTVFPPTFYPGTSDPTLASPVELHPGDDFRGLDITLLSIRAVRIRGRIVNEAISGTPSLRYVNLESRGLVGGFTTASETARRDGTFELRGVAPGSYTLYAMIADERGRAYVGQVPVDVGATDIESLTIVVGPGVEIPGRLHWEGSPPADAPNLYVVLRPREVSDFIRGGPAAKVGKEGKLTLNGVSNGDYWIEVTGAPEPCFLKSARAGGSDVLESGLMVSGGVSPGALEVVMNCKGGVVEGVVLDSQQQPASSGRVVLVPEGSRRSQSQLFKATTPDQLGHFVLDGVAPGAYKLFAWEEIEPGAYEDPQFLQAYERDGKPVEVEEGGQYSVQLELISADKVPR